MATSTVGSCIPVWEKFGWREPEIAAAFAATFGFGSMAFEATLAFAFALAFGAAESASESSESTFDPDSGSSDGGSSITELLDLVLISSEDATLELELDVIFFLVELDATFVFFASAL